MPEGDTIFRTARSLQRVLGGHVVTRFDTAYAHLDRVNVGSAALQMSRELGFTDTVFGFGGGIFFLGYILLEVPGGILAELWSARKWIARILLTWGVISSLTGFVQTAQQFYWIRFTLGVAEAGFVPAILVYFSHWYRPEDRGKAIAIFFTEGSTSAGSPRPARSRSRGGCFRRSSQTSS